MGSTGVQTSLFTGPPLKAAHSPSGPGEFSSSYLLEETCLVPLGVSTGRNFPSAAVCGDGGAGAGTHAAQRGRRQEAKTQVQAAVLRSISDLYFSLFILLLGMWRCFTAWIIWEEETEWATHKEHSSAVPSGLSAPVVGRVGGVLSIFCCPLSPLSTHLHPSLNSRNMAWMIYINDFLWPLSDLPYNNSNLWYPQSCKKVRGTRKPHEQIK